uniref:Uncharacterized protein n=1 Tax=Rhizophora mucronata TaxID=61149 RepID=A0A2P2QD72_RHIMU
MAIQKKSKEKQIISIGVWVRCEV